MSTCVLIMTDGRRELFERTMDSWMENLVAADIRHVYIHNDKPDWQLDQWLKDWCTLHLKGLDVGVHTETERSGFGGAIRNAWSQLNELHQDWDFDWVLHLEDDFLLNGRLYLPDIEQILKAHPHLAQMALRRQPWGSDAEFRGGFIEAAPEWYTQCDDGHALHWIETTRNWTTNPSLFRSELLSRGWPEDPHSEGKYGFVLKEGGLPWGSRDHEGLVPGYEVRFGILGRIEDPPLVHHIGDYRVGTSY